MLDGVKEGFRGAWEIISERANVIKKGSNKLIESWLEILPRLESYDLVITSFAMNYSINPSMEAELRGYTKDFSVERLNEIIEENKKNPLVSSVFVAVRSTVVLHQRIKSKPQEDLIIEIRVALSPEIKVFLGIPLIE